MIKVSVNVFRNMLFILTIVVFGISLNAETHHWNKGRGYHPFRYSTDKGVLIDNNSDTLRYDYFKFGKAVDEMTLSFRAKDIHGKVNKKYKFSGKADKDQSVVNPGWGFFFTGSQDTVIVSIKGGEKKTILEAQPALQVSFRSLMTNQIKEKEIIDGVNHYDGDNIWKINFENGLISVEGGNRGIKLIDEFPFKGDIENFGFYSGWGGKVLISDINLYYKDEISTSTSTVIKNLKEHFKTSKDPMEGYWAIFDRELEDTMLKLGGDYRLACVKDGDGYKMIYLSGASVNPSEWHEGDVKIRLLPSPFPGIYDIIWYDAMKKPMKNDIKAQTGDGETLLIQFPYQSSKIRLKKIEAR